MTSAIQEITTERMRCKGTTKNGSPCRAHALEGGYCFVHSPALQQKRLEARAKGGRNSAKAVRLRALVPPRLLPVYDKLETALSEVHEGGLKPQQASAMAALARAMVSVLTSGELEERLRDIESKLRGKTQ